MFRLQGVQRGYSADRRDDAVAWARASIAELER